MCMINSREVKEDISFYVCIWSNKPNPLLGDSCMGADIPVNHFNLHEKKKSQI